MSEAAAVLADGGDGGAPADGGGGAPPAVPEWAKDWEPEIGAWAGKKGYRSPADVAKGYFNLERTWGADKAGRAVIVPGEGAKPEDWDQVYKRLGRPDDPAGYGLEPKDPNDAKVAQGMMAAFHAAGLNPAQVEKVWGAIQELGSTEGDDTARAAQNKTEHDALRREWGAGYDAKVALGQRAFRTMGLDAAAIDKIEAAVGTRTVFEMAARMGEALREDAGVGATAGGGRLSREGAIAKAAELRGNPEFRAKLDSQDFRVKEAAQKELTALYQIAYPDEAA